MNRFCFIRFLDGFSVIYLFEIDYSSINVHKTSNSTGDIEFDHVGLNSDNTEEFRIIEMKEPQNRLLEIILSAVFLSHEAVDVKGVIFNIHSM